MLVASAFVIAGCNSNKESASEPTTSSSYQLPSDSGDSGSYNQDSSYSQEEWDNQEGEAWDLFDDAYLTGWDEGCDLVFDESPDGSLFDQGEEFTADDCYAKAPYDASDSDLPIDVPDDPEYDGEELGTHDGCLAAFEDTYDDALFWGDEVSVDSSICP
jgi:hypothetical protein